MLHLVVRLVVCHLATQIHDFAVCIDLYTRDLLLFSRPPNFVQVCQQRVHQRLRNVGSTLVAEVVGDFVGFFWNPVFLLFISLEVFGRTLLVRKVTVFVIPVSFRERLEEADSSPTILRKLAEVGELLCLGKQTQESRVLLSVGFHLQLRGSLGLASHNYRVEFEAGFIQFVLKFADLNVLLQKRLLCILAR